jgi:hypothetical protein
MANRTLILAAGLIAALTLASCGSSNTCSSACNTISACATKLGGTFTPADLTACNDGCNTDTCAKKQEAIDCIVALTCTTEQAVVAGLTACATSSGCNSPVAFQ